MLVDDVELVSVVLVVVVLLLVVELLVVVLDVLDVLDELEVSSAATCGAGPPEIAQAEPPDSTAAAATPARSRSARSLPTIVSPSFRASRVELFTAENDTSHRAGPEL